MLPVEINGSSENKHSLSRVAKQSQARESRIHFRARARGSNPGPLNGSRIKYRLFRASGAGVFFSPGKTKATEVAAAAVKALTVFHGFASRGINKALTRGKRICLEMEVVVW